MPTDTTKSYLALLHEELTDAHLRFERADREGRKVIEQQIRQIERDIKRISMKNGDQKFSDGVLD